MKKLLLVLFVFLGSWMKSNAQFSDLTVTYTLVHPYDPCNYNISVSALLYNPTTGAYMMSIPQYYTISVGTTQSISISRPIGFQIVPGQYLFGIQPDNGGVCSFGVDYTATPAPSTTVASLCHCTGVSTGPMSKQTYWVKNSNTQFTFYQYCPSC